MSFWVIPQVGVTTDTPISDLPGNFPAARVEGQKRAPVFLPRTIPYSLTHTPIEYSAFRKNMYVPDTGLFMMTYQIDTQHNAVNGHAVQVDGMMVYRSASTEAGLSSASFIDLPMSYDEGVIRDATHHYYTIHFPRYPLPVIAGNWYQISMKIGGKSMVSGTLDGLATMQTNGGQQFMLIEYEPGAYLI